MDADETNRLPAELRVFLHVCVDSIAQVELLMMLRGSSQVRTAREIATDLGVSMASARNDLETLAARGLLEASSGAEIAYRYRPKSEELASYVDLLAKHYVTARHLVFNFVAARSRLAAKQFADAFKWRDKK